MAIPRAVQRKAERARQLAERGQPAPRAPAPDATNVQAPPQEQVAAPQEQVQAPPGGEHADQSGMEGNPALEDWKTRYTNLRTARNEKAEQAERRVAQLEQENAELRAQLATTSTAAGSAPSPLALSEEERAGLSEDALKAYELAASKLGGQIKQQEQDTLAQREAAFFADVESVVPNWEAINANADFISWLQANDGFSGRTRLETLQQARGNLDAPTVVKLFSAFVETIGSSANNGAGVAPPAGTVVEPGRSSSVSDPRSGGDPRSREIIPQAEVQAFYRSKNELLRRKKYHGQVAEQYNAREAEIRRAHQEGRIR